VSNFGLERMCNVMWHVMVVHTHWTGTMPDILLRCAFTIQGDNLGILYTMSRHWMITGLEGLCLHLGGRPSNINDCVLKAHVGGETNAAVTHSTASTARAIKWEGRGNDERVYMSGRNPSSYLSHDDILFSYNKVLYPYSICTYSTHYTRHMRGRAGRHAISPKEILPTFVWTDRDAAGSEAVKPWVEGVLGLYRSLDGNGTWGVSAAGQDFR
jgi:hypothetical protein